MDSSLELGMLFRGIRTSSPFGDERPLPFYCLLQLPCTCSNSLSRAGLQGFRSEIGYQIFDQV